MKDIEFWVKKHGGLKNGSIFYKAEIKELFKCNSYELFESHLVNKKSKWDSSFTDYFDRFILPEACQFGRWKIEKLGLYYPFGGLTTNVSEGEFHNI